MARLTGETVILFDRVKTGVDPFGAPVFEEVPVELDNVLICPASTESVTDGMQLYGKHAVFELLIPKCDDHGWEMDATYKMSFLVNRVLGAKQKKALYDHLRDASGRVPVDAVEREMEDIFAAFGQQGKNS